MFKKFLPFAALIAMAQSAFAAHYTIDQSHSHVGFKVRHLISKTAGEFRDFEGEFKFDPHQIKQSSVNFTAKTDSINTNNDKRDDHLKGEDFFNVDKFPSMTFVSKKVTAINKTTFKVEGDLTLHGTTKPVVLSVNYTGSAKDPWGNQRSGFTATTKLNRKDFGLVWNKTLDAGGLMIGDEVEVSLEVEGIEKKADEKAAS